MQIVRDARAITETYSTWNGIKASPGGGVPVVRDPLVLTYAFPTNAPEYFAADQPNAANGFIPVSEETAKIARTALNMWQSVSNIRFVDVGPDSPADIVMVVLDDELAECNGSSFAKYPGDTSTKDTIDGDVFINNLYQDDLVLWLHELGHALGLSHPHEGEFILPENLDNIFNTVLSYNWAAGDTISRLGPIDRAGITQLYGVAAADEESTGPDGVVAEDELHVAFDGDNDDRPAPHGGLREGGQIPGLFGLSVFPQSADDIRGARKSAIAGLRDHDGDLYGEEAQWRFVGASDVLPGGGHENVYMAQVEGAPRWATLFVSDGTADLDDVSAGAGSYVLPEYVDPLVPPGHRYNSQGRFEADTRSGNINGILGVGDYDGDGGQEIYFSLANGHAVLHMYMNDDRSFRYANYQSEQDLIDFMSANGVDASVYQGWL